MNDLDRCAKEIESKMGVNLDAFRDSENGEN